MFGWSWRRRAERVKAGIAFCFTNSTLSPERAAHAAAGMANPGCSPLVTTTSPLGLARATEKKRSIPDATSYTSPPGTMAVLYPDTWAALSPMRMIWAFWARGEPAGLRRLRASLDTAGSLPPLLKRTGMPSGWAMSTDAAIAPCQLLLSTMATACGRLSGDVAGKTALTAPATSATVSAPATRVVFLVAVTGKPSSAAADLLVDWALMSAGAVPLRTLRF